VFVPGDGVGISIGKGVAVPCVTAGGFRGEIGEIGDSVSSGPSFPQADIANNAIAATINSECLEKRIFSSSSLSRGLVQENGNLDFGKLCGTTQQKTRSAFARAPCLV
jgi:hypothetical protein